MSKDHEKAFREESERAYRRWLEETGRKESEKKKKQKLHVSSKQIVPVVAVGLCIAFAVGLVFFWNSTTSALPENENALPENTPENIVENVPENIPENMAENVPENIVENAPENIIENVPEDMVLFRFTSSFTYWGEESLSGPQWGFPWPHVGEQFSVCVPDNKFVPGFSVDQETLQLIPWKHRPMTSTTKPRELGSNSFSKLVWLRVGIDRDGNVEFENVFENGYWSWTGTRFLNFWAIEEPYQNENIMAKALVEMTERGVGPRDSLRPGETVSVQGIFLVKKENAGKVRIGDLATEGLDWLPEENRWVKPILKQEETKAPLFTAFPAGEDVKNVEVLLQLEKFENGVWVIIEKFYEWFDVYLHNANFIDNAL